MSLRKWGELRRGDHLLCSARVKPKAKARSQNHSHHSMVLAMAPEPFNVKFKVRITFRLYTMPKKHLCVLLKAKCHCLMLKILAKHSYFHGYNNHWFDVLVIHTKFSDDQFKRTFTLSLWIVSFNHSLIWFALLWGNSLHRVLIANYKL